MMVRHSTNLGFYWYFYVDSPYSTAKSVDELLEWTEILFDFDDVLKYYLPVKGHWIHSWNLIRARKRE
ncbi:hypothetical protein A3L04_00760 [Thermococcus chitonophagus]|uniref:Uncharacterized protein n=1 Tax=Thermococcus chitonophagus TaxID=54262 RepID=A0A2Z2N0W7_9EURY|nr:hypothetical protein A3L04_00760 [Thermococcus chitonophagus]